MHRYLVPSVAAGLLLLQTLAQASCNVNPRYNGYQLDFNQTFTPGHGMCKHGWYCPHSDLENETTWPSMCPPSKACSELRNEGKFCVAQGTFEPSPCLGGFYCPDSKSQLRCPAGSYCHPGSIVPIKCGPLSSCAEGSSNEDQFGEGLLAAVLVDVLLVLLVVLYRHNQAVSTVSPESQMTEADASKALFELMRKARTDPTSREDKSDSSSVSSSPAPLAQLHFSFDQLSVKLPRPGGKNVGSNSGNDAQAVNPSVGGSAVLTSNVEASTAGGSGQSELKTLLRSVTGSFRPGTVTAVMGPSGAGKTVFLSTVLNRLPSSWVQEGQLKVNQDLRSVDVRHAVGFVPQDDILHPDLTVAQNIFYSSETRLPSHFTKEEREQVREHVLTVLGLQGVKHVKIGDDTERGVSGGQRKRCSVGVELVSAPTALFLDEPTTGLDAATALDLCGMLRSLATGTMSTVAMVIHQPRVEIWEALDEVLLLAPGGRTVYQGSQAEAVPYFTEHLGLSFDWGNPADVILDGIAIFGEEAAEIWESRTEQQQENQDEKSAEMDESDESKEKKASGMATPVANGASFAYQVLLAHHRALQKQEASVATFLFDIIISSMAAVVMGTAVIREEAVLLPIQPYVMVSPRPIMYICPMLAMFYLIALGATVTPSGVRSFGSELTQYWREASNGHNKLAYFVGYTIVDVYRSLIVSLHFTFFAYVMWEPLQGFWSLYIVIVLMHLNIHSQSVMLSMWLRPDTAPMFAGVVAVFMSLLNGYPQIPLINPISYSWWATEYLVGENLNPLRNLFQVDQMEESWDYKTQQPGTDIGVMLLIVLLYRVGGFVLMVVLNKEKQR